MSLPRRFQPKSAWVFLCLSMSLNLSLTQGCARPGALHRADRDTGTPTGDQSLPFHPVPDHLADDSRRPAVPAEHLSAGHLSGDPAASAAPFRTLSHMRTLPAGTLITVRLDKSLTLSRVHPGDLFSASVVGDLAMDGETVVERGTPLIGRIESIQPAASSAVSAVRSGAQNADHNGDPTGGRGYVRLTLSTLSVGGKDVALKTSSLFARGNLPSASASDASETRLNGRLPALRLLKGRRLTFRLIAPLTVGDPGSVASLQSSNP
jgi:hypothetical protein